MLESNKVLKAYLKAHNMTEELYEAKLRRKRIQDRWTKYFIWWTIFKYKDYD